MKIREFETRAAWWEENGDRARVKPLEPPQRLEIVRSGRVVAVVHVVDGQDQEAERRRAERMARAYAGELREVER